MIPLPSNVLLGLPENFMLPIETKWKEEKYLTWKTHAMTITVYDVTGSVFGQYEVNPVLWLATPTGKMGLSCLLGISCFDPVRKYIAWKGLKFFFFNFWTVWAMELQKAAEDKKNKENIVHKKRTWSICSHLDQTSLVNNAHLFPALQMICLVYCEFSLVP